MGGGFAARARGADAHRAQPRRPVVPFSGSVAFVERHPDAELVAFDATGHCNEANQEPERFHDTIAGWLRAR